MNRHKRGGFGYYNRFESDYATSSSNINIDNKSSDLTEFNPRNYINDEEGFERIIIKIIEKFKLNKGTTLPLPNMDKRQRYIVHQIAHEHELRTFSTGKEPDRYITLCHSEGFRYTTYNHSDQFAIRMKKDEALAIKNYLLKWPIDQNQVESHYNRPRDKNKSQQNGERMISFGEMLIPKQPKASLPHHIVSFRQSLPAYKMRTSILNEINNHRVILITGGTGCGKTTQVPQFLLEDANNKNKKIRIVCTQPRRLPAIAVAERVARERGEYVSDTVGYHIRLEQKTSEQTILTYCTSGVLLRMLTADSIAKNVSHIILDEVHEREQNTDYLLIALKQALKRRKDLKVILMSATMEGNKEMFLNYFQGCDIGSIDIPARLHEVDKYCLEDVLAMTGYLGSSQSSNFFTVDNWGASNCVQMYNASPQINGFAGHQIHPSASTPAFSGTDPIETLANQLGHVANSAYHRQSSANLMSYNEPVNPVSWSAYDYSSGTNGYQAMMEVNKLFPVKPKIFDSEYAKRVKNTNFDRKSLVNTYLSRGFRSYSESIDSDLVWFMISYLMDSPTDGSILVFLPGYEDINNVRNKIIDNCIGLNRQPKIYMLHSQMNSQDQQKVFERLADPKSERKVILSTNIAEASLTIDDVVYVIDCGKVKEKVYDHYSRISTLRCVWIAQSNAEQRSGRAGRCRHGYCFRLYSQEEYDNMNQTQIAEMKRAAIHDVCLHAKMFAPNGMSVKQFLGMAPEPPDNEAIENSFIFLQQIGALFSFSGSKPFDAEVGPPSYYNRDNLNDEPDLTELGTIIAHLPLDPQLARMLLYSIAFKCFNPIVTLVAALSHRDPFILPIGEEKTAALIARDEFSRVDYSDHLTLIRACFKYFASISKSNFCKQYFLAPSSMRMIDGIRKQLTFELKRLKLIPDNYRSFEDPLLNEYSNSWPMVQAAIAAGCYPGIGVAKCQSRIKKIRTQTESNAILHPGSVLKRQIQGAYRIQSLQRYGDNPEPLIDYMAFQELAQIDEGPTLRTVTATTPIHIVLFAGSSRMEKVVMRDFEVCTEEYPEVEIDPSTPNFRRDYSVEIDNFLAFRGDYELMKLLMKLRFKILNYFMMWLKNPNVAREEHAVALLNCLNELLCTEHKNCLYAYVEDLPSKKEEPIKRQEIQRHQQINKNESVNNNMSNNNNSNNNGHINNGNNNNSLNNYSRNGNHHVTHNHQERDDRNQFNRNQNRRPDKPIYQPRKRIFQRRRRPDPRPEDNSIAIQNEEDEADPPPSRQSTSRKNCDTTDECQKATKELFGMVQRMKTKA